jgi:hypothetical protein
MSPDLLVRIGGLTAFPAAPPGFIPGGAWVNRYRIHTCHGYFESGNDDVGVLRLERLPEPTGHGFTLKIRQRVVSDTGQKRTVEAWLRARPDRLGTLLEWRLKNSFEDLSGKAIPGLDVEESGRSEHGVLSLTRGGDKRTVNGERPVTADWSLFEAIQRLPHNEVDGAPFDFLEGLSILREEHKLYYRGQYLMSEPPRLRLHWFQQIGYGVLPYDYWLDDQHRLLVAGTEARAYVLDDRADERVTERLQTIRNRRSGRSNG